MSGRNNTRYTSGRTYGTMTRKRFRTIQSTNIGSSSSQPPTSIASSSQQATPPIDAVSQAAPSTPIGISSEQPTCHHLHQNNLWYHHLRTMMKRMGRSQRGKQSRSAHWRISSFARHAYEMEKEKQVLLIEQYCTKLCIHVLMDSNEC
ncbi:hypothetical protein CJ030_MR2G023035 [Morella rubra]|uniref:Uncharacterized protein n=1 Tax=Morella rubra TaxID=262757 RepID=A0A6A1WED4_9ROSI|nr:hypothetical protein CJ030_MR2G023035 [Morella rubra]